MTQPTNPQVPPGVSPQGNLPAAPPVLQYAGGGPTTPDERQMAMLLWLLGIVSGWLGPLIIWLIKRDQSRFVDFHGKQCLVLHVAVMILFVPAAIGMMLPFVGCLIVPVFALLMLGLVVVEVLMTIKANAGEWYRMPVIGEMWK